MKIKITTYFYTNQEKKQAVALLQKMTETSGISGEGISPDVEDGGLLDELTPYFKNGLHLSKKRMAVSFNISFFF